MIYFNVFGANKYIEISMIYFNVFGANKYDNCYILQRIVNIYILK